MIRTLSRKLHFFSEVSVKRMTSSWFYLSGYAYGKSLKETVREQLNQFEQKQGTSSWPSPKKTSGKAFRINFDQSISTNIKTASSISDLEIIHNYFSKEMRTVKLYSELARKAGSLTKNKKQAQSAIQFFETLAAQILKLPISRQKYLYTPSDVSSFLFFIKKSRAILYSEPIFEGFDSFTNELVLILLENINDYSWFDVMQVHLNLLLHDPLFEDVRIYEAIISKLPRYQYFIKRNFFIKAYFQSLSKHRYSLFFDQKVGPSGLGKKLLHTQSHKDSQKYQKQLQRTRTTVHKLFLETIFENANSEFQDEKGNVFSSIFLIPECTKLLIEQYPYECLKAVSELIHSNKCATQAYSKIIRSNRYSRNSIIYHCVSAILYLHQQLHRSQSDNFQNHQKVIKEAKRIKKVIAPYCVEGTTHDLQKISELDSEVLKNISKYIIVSETKRKFLHQQRQK